MSEALAVADDMLRSFFERWQRLEEAKQEISADLKELFAEMKGVGFDTKAARAVFREENKLANEDAADKVDRTEFEAMCDLYRASLKSPRAGRARESAKKSATTSKGESDAKSAHVSAENRYLIVGRRQEEPHEQDCSEQEQVRSGRNIAVSPAPRNGDDTVPADPDAPTESADAQISATNSPLQSVSSPVAIAPEPEAHPPVEGSGALIQPETASRSDGGLNIVHHHTNINFPSTVSLPVDAPEQTASPPVVSSGAPFTPPAFLLKDHARQSDVNDRCRSPAGCKFSHHPQKITCASCSSAWAASKRADRERECA